MKSWPIDLCSILNGHDDATCLEGSTCKEVSEGEGDLFLEMLLNPHLKTFIFRAHILF